MTEKVGDQQNITREAKASSHRYHAERSQSVEKTATREHRHNRKPRRCWASSFTIKYQTEGTCVFVECVSNADWIFQPLLPKWRETRSRRASCGRFSAGNRCLHSASARLQCLSRRTICLKSGWVPKYHSAAIQILCLSKCRSNQSLCHCATTTTFEIS